MNSNKINKSVVITQNQEFKTLINAVINNIGEESVSDVNSHGIDGGFNGFIYYDDTHKFAMRYRKLIIKLLEQEADSMGDDVMHMVSTFKPFRKMGMDADDKKDFYKYMGGGKPEQGAITNIMAWFAAETVCRMFER